MDSLSKQISKALAEKNGWPLDFAEGFLQGNYSRASGGGISLYCKVGIDGYSNGFRAGYYVRHATTPISILQRAA